MKFLDEVKIFVKSGDGGNGLSSFHREKFIEFGGPNGGNGGPGGHVYFVGKKNLNTLIDFRYAKKHSAENGRPGGSANKTGHSGADLYLSIPLGTEVIDEQTGIVLYEAMKDQESQLIFSGGRGGLGNACFKSSTRQAPTKITLGKKGIDAEIRLKLKIIADVGIVGLPNAGKSTFLSKISNAQPKIGNYDFTTLHPNLGMASVDGKELLFADTPGIIEGAHQGLGLGVKFLKHIERCKVLIHFIDINNKVDESFATVINEIQQYSEKINLPIFIILNKSDLLDKKIVNQKVKLIKEISKSEMVYALSTFNAENVNDLLRKIFNIYFAD